MPLLNESSSSLLPQASCGSNDPSLLWIKLCALDLETIIGIFPEERRQPQALQVELQFAVKSADWLIAATSGDLSRSLDYSKVVNHIKALITQARFRLLESLYYTLAYLFLRPPHHSEGRVQVEALRIKIIKPHALSTKMSPYPCLEGEIHRREWSQLQQTPSPIGDTEIPLLDLRDQLSKTVDTHVILRLPELTLYHLMSSEDGHLHICSPYQHLIPLIDHISCNQRHYSWRGGFSALLLSREETHL